MTDEQRDELLVELRTTMRFVQSDINTVKKAVAAERKDLAKVKLKIYTFSGLINGVTIAANFAFWLWTKLPTLHQQ